MGITRSRKHRSVEHFICDGRRTGAFGDLCARHDGEHVQAVIHDAVEIMPIQLVMLARASVVLAAPPHPSARFIMNISCSRSAEQLTSTISGQAWHGDSLREILEDVTAEEAQAHPVANVRSIWEIVLHLDAWVEFFSGAVRGTPIPAWATMAKAQDWPYIGIVSDEAWERCVGSLLHHHSELAEAIEAFGDARLDATVPGRTYNFNRLFQSASLHAAYHAGQIALLKKMIR